MTTPEPLNPGLARLHRFFYVGFAALGIIILLFGVDALSRGKSAVWIGLLALLYVPFFTLHWYAAKGAREGKAYGRTLSRIIGTLWLLGVPIGTALGIYVWSRTGRKYWKADVSDAGVSRASQ